MQHRYDLKHALVARAQAEDKEKEVQRTRRSLKMSYGKQERSCKPSRVTCGPR